MPQCKILYVSFTPKVHCVQKDTVSTDLFVWYVLNSKVKLNPLSIEKFYKRVNYENCSILFIRPF